MVFNVCFDPKVIDVAAANAPFGMQTLTAMLRGFVANCLMFDFEDDRLQREIRVVLDALPEKFDRSEIKKLFAQLAKRNRFVAVMVPDYLSEESGIDQALGQATTHSIQLFVTEREPSRTAPTSVEVTNLATYQDTAFERGRFDCATSGKAFAGGESGDAVFLSDIFGNAVRHARRIEICDRLAAEKFGDNYERTIRQFFGLLKSVLAEPGRCEVVFHCGRTRGRDEHFCNVLKSLRGEQMSDTTIKVRFYEAQEPSKALPHERYLWTDQFAFFIGRGMDLIAADTRQNRDVLIGFASETEIDRIVASFAGFNVKTETI